MELVEKGLNPATTLKQGVVALLMLLYSQKGLNGNNLNELPPKHGSKLATISRR